MTLRQHSAEIIVNRTSKDTAENYPQIGRRAKLGTHDGTENRSCAGNIKKLNHKDFPSRQYYIVYAVGHTYSRCRTVVGSKHALYDASINEIAHHKGNQT